MDWTPAPNLQYVSRNRHIGDAVPLPSAYATTAEAVKARSSHQDDTQSVETWPNPDWAPTLGLILETLRNFPEASRAVREALRPDC